MHFPSTSSQAPIESIQKVYHFVNQRRDQRPVSQSNLQVRSTERLLYGNYVQEEKKPTASYATNDNRSISRSKSRERPQSYSYIQSSRSSSNIHHTKNQNSYANIHASQNLRQAQKNEQDILTRRVPSGSTSRGTSSTSRPSYIERKDSISTFNIQQSPKRNAVSVQRQRERDTVFPSSREQSLMYSHTPTGSYADISNHASNAKK